MPLLAALFACLCLSAADPSFIHEVRLSESILLLQQGRWDDLLLVVDAGPNLVVIDAWSSPALAAIGRQRAERTFGKKVGTLIDTSQRWDLAYRRRASMDARGTGKDEAASITRRRAGSSPS